MQEFFKGWRRKWGLVALLLGCMLMAGWVRSLLGFDYVKMPIAANVIFGISSVDQAIALKFGYDEEDDNEFLWVFDDRRYWGSVGYHQDAFSDIRHQYPMYILEGDCPTWYWNWCGLSLGESPHQYYPSTRQSFLLVPYWFLVAPMLVLSLRLLIRSSPQRRSNSSVPTLSNKMAYQ